MYENPGQRERLNSIVKAIMEALDSTGDAQIRKLEW